MGPHPFRPTPSSRMGGGVAALLRCPLHTRQPELPGLCVPARFPAFPARPRCSPRRRRRSLLPGPTNGPTYDVCRPDARASTDARRGAGAADRAHTVQADNLIQPRVPGRSPPVPSGNRQHPGDRDHRAGCSRDTSLPTRPAWRSSPSPRLRRTAAPPSSEPQPGPFTRGWQGAAHPQRPSGRRAG